LLERVGHIEEKVVFPVVQVMLHPIAFGPLDRGKPIPREWGNKEWGSKQISVRSRVGALHLLPLQAHGYLYKPIPEGPEPPRKKEEPFE
jgi:hypothetical protein